MSSNPGTLTPPWCRVMTKKTNKKILRGCQLPKYLLVFYTQYKNLPRSGSGPSRQRLWCTEESLPKVGAGGKISPCVCVCTRIDYLVADILPVYLHQVLSEFWRSIIAGESIDPKAIKLLKRFHHKLVTFGFGSYGRNTVFTHTRQS